jgi:CBS domain-containing protein
MAGETIYLGGGAPFAGRPAGTTREGGIDMRASDVMTTEVVSATADTPVREVARRLLAHGISAVPVLDADGAPIGMVSEGDLVSRDEVERVERRDWWLKLVADDAAPDAKLLAGLRAPDRTAGDVMAAPVITVAEDTELAEVARLLAQQHIKRVPVVKQGRVVGIVSRADLLGALATPQTDARAPGPAAAGRGFLFSLFGEYRRPGWQVVPPHEDAPPKSASAGLDAAAFRALVEDFETSTTQQRDDTRRVAAEQRQRLAKELIDTHVSDAVWQDLLHRARQAAEAGGKECLLLRFPNELCTDGGRAIDVAQEGWPATLRGEAAELYLRWERELKGRGFRLAARVLEYPDGMPGDIGLFLVWGEAS